MAQLGSSSAPLMTVAIAVAAALAGTPAAAEAPAEYVLSDSTAVEEIVVTARKRRSPTTSRCWRG